MIVFSGGSHRFERSTVCKQHCCVIVSSVLTLGSASGELACELAVVHIFEFEAQKHINDLCRPLL